MILCPTAESNQKETDLTIEDLLTILIDYRIYLE